jgi:hypothetical protein
MQEQKPAAQKPVRGRLRHLGKALVYAWRARSANPAAEEQLGTFLEEKVGTPKEMVALLKKLNRAREKARKDNAYYLSIDRYVTGAIAAVNLLLLQAFVSIGTPDTPSLITLLALAASLPLASGSLFYSFLKGQGKITSYGITHNLLSFSAHTAGVTAIAAAIWHVSPIAGIVFLCFAIGVYALCTSFIMLSGIRMHWEHEVAAPGATPVQAQEPTEPASANS